MLKTSTVCAKTLLKTADNFTFLTPEAKLVFLQLRQAFTKAFILYHFDPKRSIWIETDTSTYIINAILSQLISESG